MDDKWYHNMMAAEWHTVEIDGMPEKNQQIIFILQDGEVVTGTLQNILQRIHINKIVMWTEMPKLEMPKLRE